MSLCERIARSSFSCSPRAFISFSHLSLIAISIPHANPETAGKSGQRSHCAILKHCRSCDIGESPLGRVGYAMLWSRGAKKEGGSLVYWVSLLLVFLPFHRPLNPPPPAVPRFASRNRTCFRTVASKYTKMVNKIIPNRVNMLPPRDQGWGNKACAYQRDHISSCSAAYEFSAGVGYDRSPSWPWR